MVTRIQALIHCPDCLSDITAYIENLASPDYYSNSDFTDSDHSDTDAIISDSDCSPTHSPIINHPKFDPPILKCQASKENSKSQNKGRRKESSQMLKRRRTLVFQGPAATECNMESTKDTPRNEKPST